MAVQSVSAPKVTEVMGSDMTIVMFISEVAVAETKVGAVTSTVTVEASVTAVTLVPALAPSVKSIVKVTTPSVSAPFTMYSAVQLAPGVGPWIRGAWRPVGPVRRDLGGARVNSRLSGSLGTWPLRGTPRGRAVVRGLPR